MKEKRGHFLYRLFYPKESFFKIRVFSQCIVYWIHFQNIHAFTHQKTLIVCWIHFQNMHAFIRQKTLLHALLLLVFKIVENLHCIFQANHLAYIGAQNRKFASIYVVTSFSCEKSVIILINRNCVIREAK